MGVALARHDEIVRGAIDANGGQCSRPRVTVSPRCSVGRRMRSPQGCAAAGLVREAWAVARCCGFAWGFTPVRPRNATGDFFGLR